MVLRSTGPTGTVLKMAALMHMMRSRSLAALAHARAMLQFGKACTLSPFGLLASSFGVIEVGNALNKE